VYQALLSGTNPWINLAANTMPERSTGEEKKLILTHSLATKKVYGLSPNFYFEAMFIERQFKSSAFREC
jgi:hypothetical protein